MNNNPKRESWKQQIDEELGNAKWTPQLSAAIEQRAVKRKNHFIPIVSVAMLAIIFFLIVTGLQQAPNKTAATITEIEQVKHIYYIENNGESTSFVAKPSTFYLQVESIKQQKMFEEMALILQEAKPIEEVENAAYNFVDVVIIDRNKQRWNLKLSLTEDDVLAIKNVDTNELFVYENASSLDITNKLFEWKILNFKAFAAYFIPLLIVWIFADKWLRKRYSLEKRKYRLDNIRLDKVMKFAPSAYMFFIIIYGAIKNHVIHVSLFIVPLIIYTTVLIYLMKREQQAIGYIKKELFDMFFVLLIIIGLEILI